MIASTRVTSSHFGIELVGMPRLGAETLVALLPGGGAIVRPCKETADDASASGVANPNTLIVEPPNAIPLASTAGTRVISLNCRIGGETADELPPFASIHSANPPTRIWDGLLGAEDCRWRAAALRLAAIATAAAATEEEERRRPNGGDGGRGVFAAHGPTPAAPQVALHISLKTIVGGGNTIFIPYDCCSMEYITNKVCSQKLATVIPPGWLHVGIR